jgi:hypothetical protein
MQLRHNGRVLYEKTSVACYSPVWLGDNYRIPSRLQS